MIKNGNSQLKKNTLMKYFTLVLAFIVIAVVSCKKDQCPAEDFTGTYVGDRTCAGTNSMDNDTVIVTRLSDDRLSYSIFTYNLEGDIDGCDLTIDDNTFLSTGRRGSASLEGTTLTLSYESVAAGLIIEECVFVGELQ